MADPVFTNKLAAALILASLAAAPAMAGDWPQILGPTRNGIAADEKLADHWPSAGPRVVWQRPVGQGVAGLAVVGDRAVLFHRLEDEEVVECLDVASGKPVWKDGQPTRYSSGILSDSGPRCVPVISQGKVITYGAAGRLSCYSLADGKRLWTRDTHGDFNAPEGYFGAGSSPVVEEDRVMVNVGSREGAGIVAFSLDKGETVWKSTDDQASYSSPVMATIGDVRHAIFVTRLAVVSLDPKTGAERFRFAFGERGPTVNGANPVVWDDHLFVTASYGIGAVLAKVTPKGVEEVWRRDDVLSSQYTTSIRAGDAFYGIDGRQDVGVAALKAFDPIAGKVHWSKDDFSTATLILADSKLLAMKTDGHLLMIEPTAKAYHELASAEIFSDETRALPALAAGKLYVRDGSTLKCLDLAK